jgi:DNA-directed RNA polymerase specialized sigma24 family protein
VGRHLVARVVLDEPVIEPLVGRTLDGEERARAKLWLTLSPVIEKIAGQWRVTGKLHDREDDRRDVVVGVMGRLEANGFQRLGVFHGLLQRRNGTASAWFRVLTIRSALRHTEAHPEYLGPAVGEGGSRWADLVPFSDEEEEELPPGSLRVIEAILAHEIMACAERTLPPQQLDAVRLSAVDLSNAKIAEALNLPNADAADKLVRAAHKRLRTRFAGERDDATGAPRNLSRAR